MESDRTITFEELDKTVRNVRSLSGCFRLARGIELRDMDVERSRDKIALLTQLLEKMRELSGIDPETIGATDIRENKLLIRHYAVVLAARAGQRNIGGEGLSEAESDARLALRMALVIKDEAVVPLTLNHLGNNLMLTQRVAEAHECFTRSAELDRRNGSSGGDLARSLYNLARAELALGRFENALAAVDEGLNLHTSDSPLPVHAHAFFLSVRQDVHESRDEQGQALADGLRSLELFQQTGMTDRMPMAHFHLVRRYIVLDQPSEAMHHAMQVSEAASVTRNPVDMILSQIALASVYIRVDDLESAERFCHEGLNLARTISLRPMQVMCLERLARIARRRGDMETAEKLLHEGLSMEDGPRNRADLHRILASLLLEMGRLERAEEEIGTALEIIGGLKDMKMNAEYHIVAADIARRAGRFDQAIDTLTSVLNRENLRLAHCRDAHRLLSDVYKELRDPEKALHHMQLYHDFSMKLEGRLAEHRLIVLRAQHEIEEHRKGALKAQEMQRRTEREKEALAMEVSKRERVLEQVRQQVGLAARSLTENNIREGERMLQETLRLLHRAPASSQDLLHHLPNLDKEFFQRLRKLYPELTIGQIRLCGLLRSGLSSSEIAQHLHLTIDTVITQRKRLRKKMALRTGEKLERMLAEI